MQTITFKNPEDTRRGVVIGKEVHFLIRLTGKKARAQRASLKQFWKKTYKNAALALEVAEAWAIKGIKPVK